MKKFAKANPVAKKSEVDIDEDDRQYEFTEESLAPNPTSIKDRIDNGLESLANLKLRKDKSLSRSDLIELLSRDLSEYYGYIQELSDFLLELFSPAECVEYMDASDRPRPLVIRTNTLKTTRKDLMEALGKRGCMLEGIDWSKVAIKVTESSVPIGATPEYLAGHYMLQSAASLNPVMALAPQPGERVLDMSAAPGGKTSYVAQLMKNSGTIIANDLKPQRQKATIANLHRMGVKNAIICCYDGRKIPQLMKNFDRVLLDAPCSGLGVISRDQSVKLQRTVKDIQRIAHLQKELLCAAVDCVDPKSPTGGIIVYSTCSISCEENEQVVDYILRKRYVRLVETGLEVGKPGLTRHKERRFHPSLALTRRFYPHVHNMDGFYVAKLKKYANGVRSADEDEKEEEEGDGDAGTDGEGGDGDEEVDVPDWDEAESEGSKKAALKRLKKDAAARGRREQGKGKDAPLDSDGHAAEPEVLAKEEPAGEKEGKAVKKTGKKKDKEPSGEMVVVSAAVEAPVAAAMESAVKPAKNRKNKVPPIEADENTSSASEEPAESKEREVVKPKKKTRKVAEPRAAVEAPEEVMVAVEGKGDGGDEDAVESQAEPEIALHKARKPKKRSLYGARAQGALGGKGGV